MDSLDDFRAAIADLMTEFGGPVSYRHVGASGSAYDPSTGEYTQGATTYDLKGILMDMPLKRNGMQVKDGTMIQDGDKLLYVVPATGMLEVTNQPLENIAADTVTAGGTVWRVYNVKEVNPMGTGSIVYEFYLRR